MAAQSGRQRPRVVPSPSPTPAQQTDREGGESQNRRPPVLGGNVRNPAPSPTPTPSGEETQVEEDDSEVIRVETNLVAFPVSVLTRDGQFVPGLTQQDFQIFENGVRQDIGHFQSVETPFTVILMIDSSPSTRYKMDEIQDAAMAFINQLRPNDRVMVISFDDDTQILCPPTNDRWRIQNAIRRLEFGSGTSLYKAVDEIIDRELATIDGRKAVVLFTDGVDTTSRGASYQSTVRNAEEADAIFFPIRYDTFNDMGGYSGTGQRGGYPTGRRAGTGSVLGTIINIILTGNVPATGGRSTGGGVGGAGTSRSDYETGKRYLEDLASVTGGRTFDGSDDLGFAFAGIAEELRRQYSVGYYPEKDGEPGERKEIRVRVMRPNLVVKAKRSYIVGK